MDTSEIKAEVQVVEDKVKNTVVGLTKHFDLFHILLGVIGIVLFMYVALTWNKPTNTIPSTTYVNVPQQKIVEKIKRVEVPGPTKIITIEKPIIVEKLKLPDWFKNDVNQQAIANADIPPSKAGYSAVGTLDTLTGKGDIIAKEKIRSFIGMPNNISIGGRWGIVTTGKQEIDGYAKWQPLRLGNTYIGAYTELNTNPEAKIMVDVEYKFKTD